MRHMKLGWGNTIQGDPDQGQPQSTEIYLHLTERPQMSVKETHDRFLDLSFFPVLPHPRRPRLQFHEGKPAQGALALLTKISRRCVSRARRHRDHRNRGHIILNLRCDMFLWRWGAAGWLGGFANAEFRQQLFHEGGIGGRTLYQSRNGVLSCTYHTRSCWTHRCRTLIPPMPLHAA